MRVLNAVVDNLDLSAIESSYEGGGASSYNPRMLTKVVFYAYLQNVYSGRKMETLLRRDVNFMWLSGMQTPDFNTINLFRKNRLAAVVDDLFTQVVQMLVDHSENGDYDRIAIFMSEIVIFRLSRSTFLTIESRPATATRP